MVWTHGKELIAQYSYLWMAEVGGHTFNSLSKSLHYLSANHQQLIGKYCITVVRVCNLWRRHMAVLNTGKKNKKNEDSFCSLRTTTCCRPIKITTCFHDANTARWISSEGKQTLKQWLSVAVIIKILEKNFTSPPTVCRVVPLPVVRKFVFLERFYCRRSAQQSDRGRQQGVFN